MNEYHLSGHLTRDPESHSFPSGAVVVTFGVAHNERYKKANGEVVEKVVFLDVKAWNGTGDFILKYFKKGDPVVIHGSVQQDSWEKDGQKRTKHYVEARRCEFPLSPGKDKGERPEARDDRRAADAYRAHDDGGDADEGIPF